MQIVLGSIFGTLPEPRTLDVDADVVDVRIAFGKGYGVFAPAAAKFKHYRIVIVENDFVPSALDREIARKRLVDGMQYKEISEELGIELNTVRTRIRRARQIIDKLSKEGDNDV